MKWPIVSRILLAAAVLSCSNQAAPAAECESAKLLASDGAAGDDFGASVSVDGVVAVVGAPEDDDDGGSSGSAYVYRFDGVSWVQEQKLTASDAEGGDDYGFSVGVSGDTIVVGAPRDDHLPAGSRAGSAYVYRFNGATWDEEDRLFASDAAADDRFGQSAAIDGETILLGAIQHDDGASNAGAGYVFTRSGTTWSEQAKLTAAVPTGTNPQMGRSASLDGDVAVLGAWQSAPAAMFSVGAAYVFRRTGTNWSEEQELTASDAADFRWFGQSVAVSGTTIAVGAYGDQSAGLGESGGIYFFSFDGATWSEDQNLNASDAANGDRFGWSIDLEGDEAIVGTGSSAAKAYRFVRTAGVWSEQAMLDTTDPDASSEYGYSVALSGGTVVIGDSNGQSTTGLAFVFLIAGIDCNVNGICDARDIAEGTSLDTNTNGIPDECECPEDCALLIDGEVNVTDLLRLLADWGLAGPCDLGGDGTDVADLLQILAAWGSCP